MSCYSREISHENVSRTVVLKTFRVPKYFSVQLTRSHTRVVPFNAMFSSYVHVGMFTGVNSRRNAVWLRVTVSSPLSRATAATLLKFQGPATAARARYTRNDRMRVQNQREYGEIFDCPR